MSDEKLPGQERTRAEVEAVVEGVVDELFRRAFPSVRFAEPAPRDTTGQSPRKEKFWQRRLRLRAFKARRRK